MPTRPIHRRQHLRHLTWLARRCPEFNYPRPNRRHPGRPVSRAKAYRLTVMGLRWLIPCGICGQNHCRCYYFS